MKTRISMAKICEYALSYVDSRIGGLYSILDQLNEHEEHIAIQKIQDFRSEWDDIHDILLDYLKK